MNNALGFPASGLHDEVQVPVKVRRRALPRTVHKRRVCNDDRNYFLVPWTVTGDLAVGSYGPMFRADRPYWVARVSGHVGRHDDATHPLDGTPSGSAIRVNVRRVTKDETGDAAVMASDSRVNIQPDKHHDSTNDDDEGVLVEADVAILKLEIGEALYPVITQVGSGRPGHLIDIHAILVPVP